jgi:hypothetical protein
LEAHLVCGSRFYTFLEKKQNIIMVQNLEFQNEQ